MDPINRLFAGLTRAAPGNDASTREALRRLPPLPPSPRILDLGCGPGSHSLILAQQLGGRLDAIDLLQPFVDQVAERAAAAGLSDRLRARQGDFTRLDEPLGSVDLVWAEGSAYAAAFETALRLWRPMLKPGGVVAASELVWLTAAPPAEAVAFWAADYPDMTSIAGTIARAEAAGYVVFDHFVLPDSAWDAYYGPLAARLDAVRDDPELASLIPGFDQEIAIRQRHGDSFGYCFCLMRSDTNQ